MTTASDLQELCFMVCRRAKSRFSGALYGAMIWLVLQSITLGADGETWPGYRGEGRDGHAARLPRDLSKLELLWRHELSNSGVGGVAATDDFVVVSGRDKDDQEDRFVCLDPIVGTELWTLQYPATLSLDYGNSPRATPMINDPYVYLLGAGGHFHCVDLDSGEVKWSRHMVDDYQGERPPWGYGGSPLLDADKLIFQPGGSHRSIVAVDAKSGKLMWHDKAEQTGYASLQLIDHGGPRQVFGFDRKSLVGWDVENGKRLWSVTPEGTTEFHVPMPMVHAKGIITSGENRGTCLYEWVNPQQLAPQFQSQQFELAPDMHSPVANKDFVFGVQDALLAVDVEKEMSIAWRVDDKAFTQFCSLILAGDRLLVLTEKSELLLIDVTPDAKGDRILARENLSDGSGRSLSHPALVGDVLYVRTNAALSAWSLGE
jgi:outer membrane protein assembly factor BamB